MSPATHPIARRPSRWDEPFGVDMSDAIVGALLRMTPFSKMNAGKFPESLPLRGILRNDARVIDVEQGGVIIREGDYGNSAFLILTGTALVCLDPQERRVGTVHRVNRKLTLIERLMQSLRVHRVPEYREPEASRVVSDWRERSGGKSSRLFVQDIPRLLESDRTITLEPGEIFGELAALTRTARSATILAESDCSLLEIRWQGLRDLIRFDAALQQQVESLYRQNSLNVHLRETPILKDLPPESLQIVANATRFESYGDFDWHHDYRRNRSQDAASAVAGEPQISAEGDYPDGLILIRSGFARLARRSGVGEETIAYLGKGHYFGIEELWHNWKHGKSHPLLHTLRAIGYVDILRIPTDVLEDHVFPYVDPAEIPFPFETDQRKRPPQDRLEFLVDQRLINGTQAMVIDVDRCTRCDDCLRACAQAHEGNPRFVRQGPIHDGLMFAGACMHCADPVCMIGCPTGAISRLPDRGTVAIRDDICVGCSTCANSCPYDNIRMVEIRDQSGVALHDDATGLPILKATKCDLCDNQPQGPACQRSCPHDALVRIDLSTMKPLEEWTRR